MKATNLPISTPLPDADAHAQTSCERLANGPAVFVSDVHRFGTDAMLLSAFCGVRRNESVCDLGSGCGILPLRFFDGGHRGRCTAVELASEGAALLQKAIDENQCTNIQSVCADLRIFSDTSGYDVVSCNPPYFKGGYESRIPARRAARHELTCTIQDVAQAANRLLKDGGRLCVCQRPERLADVICALREAHIEPKVLRFVRQRANIGTPWLFLLQGQKRRAAGMRLLPELIIEDENGQFSQELLCIYGKQEAPRP